MDIVTILITFFGLFSLTGALECYTCDNCLKETGHIETCVIGLIDLVNQQTSQCGTFIDDHGVVSRGCTNTVDCETKKCEIGMETECSKCCSTDLCNGATSSVITASAHRALECYLCHYCEKETGHTEACDINQPTRQMCGRHIDDHGVVNRGCTSERECIVGIIAEKECTAGMEIDCLTCCSTDLCNAATPSVITISATSYFIIIVTTMTMWLLK